MLDDRSLAHAMAPVFAPTERSRGLPNLCYVDPSYHRLEAERLLARDWLCVGVGADIPLRGDAMAIDAAGQPILLVRDRDGGIRAFHNVCRHRGSLLVEDRHSGPVLVCPYHSWSYALDGRLVRTPEVGGPGVHACPSVDKESLGLLPVRVDVWLDFLFVNLSGDAPPLDRVVAPMAERWGDYATEMLVHAASDTYELRANWKLAIENYLECYHLPWVHPGLNSYSPLDAHEYRVLADRFFGPVTNIYRASVAPEKTLPCFPGLPEARRLVGEYPIALPNLLLGIQRDHLFGIIIDPLAVDHTRERLHIYLVDDGVTRSEAEIARIAAAKTDLVAGWREVFTEDIGIVERMQRGRASGAFDGGKLTAFHDGCTQRFMQHVARMVAPSSEPRDRERVSA
ncbi:aromatic ring-hydroxylating dioxygenase subunit alpha [Thalassobaculum sp.]|uniref:aromatic ring-hydroxylating oxygenase subunit alpha n=1 Tax=Thalassobaculum sp. TaxID=2022740 RepID=UPI0032EB9F71